MTHGIDGIELKWFQSYLTNRKQHCYINGILSDNGDIKCGVPNSSILGPLLFLIYINDLPGSLSYSIPSMYADDTSITNSGTVVLSIENEINEDLNKLKSWLQTNRLSLNVVKSEFMMIGSRQRLAQLTSDPKLYIGDTKLKRVENTVSLGVTIDENLNWKDHVAKVCKKVSSGLGALRRVRDVVPSESLNFVYKALVQSHFDYCSSVWDTCDKGLRLRLQRLQNRAARIITRSGYDVRSIDLLRALEWQPLEDRWRNQKVVTMFKVKNDLVPRYLIDHFVPVNECHDYETRGCDVNFKVPKPRTNFLKRSFAYSGVVSWNLLPLETKEAKTISSFRKNLFN